MPRLAPSFLRRAYAISPHLVPLLSVCRDLSSARNELRWIREHVLSSLDATTSRSDIERHVKRLCFSRSHGAPLQYLLGSQPFGPLDIECSPGVLIPRPETEAWVYHLAGIIRNEKAFLREGSATKQSTFRVVDFCTGTGCIPLLMASLLRSDFHKLDLHGFDINPTAIQLARRNIERNRSYVSSSDGEKAPIVHFYEHDIFAGSWKRILDEHGSHAPRVDILVSNPPYISQQGFQRDTERSVRKFEPKLALVPDDSLSYLYPGINREDVFYAKLMEITKEFRPKMALFEVGDLQQAIRAAQLAITGGSWADVEIWRDWPDMTPSQNEEAAVDIGGRTVKIRGSGNGRLVYLRACYDQERQEVRPS